MIAEVIGQKYDSHLPEVYLQNPDRWSPYILIEPECVTIGLRERGTRQTKEKRVYERNVALRHRFEVQELLESAFTVFLEEIGIVPNRRLESEIQETVTDSIDMYGVAEDKAEVKFDYVTISQDAVGGRVLYVVLVSEIEIHKIPVTRHLHDIKQLGRIARGQFVSVVRSLLAEFNLSDEDMDKAVKECVRTMRIEKLLK